MYLVFLVLQFMFPSTFYIILSFVSWRLGIQAQVLLHVPQVFLLTKPSLQPSFEILLVYLL